MGTKIGRTFLTMACFPTFPFQGMVDLKKKKKCTEDGTPTFSRSWRSCLLLASREHKFCSGATTVQMHRPSGSCAELYTCQPSLGLIWVWANQWQTHNTELHYRIKRRWVCNILSKASFLMTFLFLFFKVTKRLNNFYRQQSFIHFHLPYGSPGGEFLFLFVRIINYVLTLQHFLLFFCHIWTF